MKALMSRADGPITYKCLSEFITLLFDWALINILLNNHDVNTQAIRYNLIKFDLNNKEKRVLSPSGKCLLGLRGETLCIVQKETTVVCKARSLLLHQGFPRPNSAYIWTSPVNGNFISQLPRYTLYINIPVYLDQGFPMEVIPSR